MTRSLTRRRLLQGSLTGAGVVLLAACGAPAVQNTPANTPAAAAQATAAPTRAQAPTQATPTRAAAPAAVTPTALAQAQAGPLAAITVNAESTLGKAAVDKWIEDFKKVEPNITIEYVQDTAPGADRTARLLNQIASNTLPDLTFLVDSVLKRAIIAGAMEPLDPLIQRDNLQLPPAGQEYATYNRRESGDGKLYSMYFRITPWTVFYNKGIFDRAGVPYPKEPVSWQQIAEIAEKVHNPSQGYWALLVQENVIFNTSLQSAGIDVVTPDAKAMNLGNREILDMLNLINDISVTRQFGIPVEEQRAFTNPMYTLANGKVAMMVGQSVWNFETTRQAAAANVDWDIAVGPRWKQSQNNPARQIFGAWNIPKSSKAKEAAWRFMRWQVSAGGQRSVAEVNVAMPFSEDPEILRIFTKDGTAAPKNIKAYYVQASPPPPVYPKSGEINMLQGELMTRFTKGEINANQFISEYESRGNAILAS